MNRKSVVTLYFRSLLAIVAVGGCYPDMDLLRSGSGASGGAGAAASASSAGANTTAGSEATAGGKGGAATEPGTGGGGISGTVNGGSAEAGADDGGSADGGAVNEGGGAGGAGEAGGCHPPSPVIGAPPIVRYNFEEGTGTSVSNSSGSANAGTLFGTTWQASGHSGGGIDFTGDGQRVVVPAGVLKDVAAMTVMVWVKLSTAPAGSTLFDFGTGAGEHLALEVNDGASPPKIKLIAKTAQLDQSVAAQIALPTVRWHHVAVTLGAGQATIYVDGRPLARGAMTLTPADLGVLAAGWLGQPRGSGANTLGTVDDFRLYDRLVDAKEIAQIALEGADYTYFTFDEACANQVFAAAPADAKAMLPNGATVVPGRLGNALEFNVQNKTEQHAVLPNGIIHNCTAGLTFAAWVNLKTSNPWSRVFDLGTGTTTFMYLSPVTGTGTIRFAAKLNAGEAAFNDEQPLARPTPLDLGVWHHLAVVLGSGNSGLLYLDGVNVASSTMITIKPSDMGVTLQNYLGKSQYPTDDYLSGRMDEVVISCRAFNSDEIQLLAKLAPAE